MADDLTTVDVGFDRVEAELIAARVRAEEFRVELLLMDSAGNAPGLVALQEHRLLVARADADLVRELAAADFA